jgi:hypothetical protein
MEVTDISTGHFVFPPLFEKEVSYERLKKAISDAGYEVSRAWVQVKGVFMKTEKQIKAGKTGQVFHLEKGERLAELTEKAGTQDIVTVFGEWRTRNGMESISIHKVIAIEKEAGK